MTDTSQSEQSFVVFTLALGGWPRKRLGPIRSTPERALDDARLLYRQSALAVAAEGSARAEQLARMAGLSRGWRRSGAVVGEG